MLPRERPIFFTTVAPTIVGLPYMRDGYDRTLPDMMELIRRYVCMDKTSLNCTVVNAQKVTTHKNRIHITTNVVPSISIDVGTQLKIKEDDDTLFIIVDKLDSTTYVLELSDVDKRIEDIRDLSTFANNAVYMAGLGWTLVHSTENHIVITPRTPYNKVFYLFRYSDSFTQWSDYVNTSEQLRIRNNNNNQIDHQANESNWKLTFQIVMLSNYITTDSVEENIAKFEITEQKTNTMYYSPRLEYSYIRPRTVCRRIGGIPNNQSSVYGQFSLNGNADRSHWYIIGTSRFFAFGVYHTVNGTNADKGFTHGSLGVLDSAVPNEVSYTVSTSLLSYPERLCRLEDNEQYTNMMTHQMPASVGHGNNPSITMATLPYNRYEKVTCERYAAQFVNAHSGFNYPNRAQFLLQVHANAFNSLANGNFSQTQGSAALQPIIHLPYFSTLFSINILRENGYKMMRLEGEQYISFSAFGSPFTTYTYCLTKPFGVKGF